MGLFEQLPYTNFHDLNLTELIKFVNETIKHIHEMDLAIEEQNTVINDFKNYVMDYLNNLNVTQDVRDYIDELITNGTMRDIIDESSRFVNTDWSNRRCLFLGDSYMTGWTPDNDVTDKFVDIIASILNLSAHWNYSVGGVGFSYARPYHYLEMFNNFLSDHPNEEVTDVFIMGGYNDNTEGRLDIVSSSANPYNGHVTISSIRAVYPKAQIHIAYIGRGAGVNTARSYIANINKCARYYKDIARDMNCDYINGSEFMLHDYRDLSSDGIHPNQSGNNHIAWYTVDVLLHGEFEFTNTGDWHRWELDRNLTGTNKTKLMPPFSVVPIFEQLTKNGVVIQGRQQTVNFFSNPVNGVNLDGSNYDNALCIGKVCGTSDCRNFISNFGNSNQIVIPIQMSSIYEISGVHTVLTNEGNLIIDEDGTVLLQVTHVLPNQTFPADSPAKFVIIPAFEFTIPLEMC